MVKVPFFENEQYMYPQPLMHVRLSIICFVSFESLTGGNEKETTGKAWILWV